MNKETKFKVGEKAHKTKGYKFPCTIVGVFETIKGDIRVVGEMDEYGLLHIFNEDQLEHVEQKVMNKEQIINEAYENYVRNTPEQHVVGSDSDPMRQCMVWKRKTDSSSGYPILERLLQEQFINKCKTDPEFSEKWGLKIEERELSESERLLIFLNEAESLTIPTTTEELDNYEIPTKLITLTYKDTIIESYE
jgi:hypothetical protein